MREHRSQLPAFLAEHVEFPQRIIALVAREPVVPDHRNSEFIRSSHAMKRTWNVRAQLPI